MNEQIEIEPHYRETGQGRRFAIATYAQYQSRGGVIFIPPLAEEMNKSRRMAALTACALARRGWHVLRFDLKGCGDSDGDFCDSTWVNWLDDISFWVTQLRERTNGPILIWGMRAGALLASAWLQEQKAAFPLILWQPVTSGQQHLNQFLRLRPAAEMLGAGQARSVVTNLKAQLSAGETVSVAGYKLNPKLANSLSKAKLKLPADYRPAVSLFEVLPNLQTSPSPAVMRLAESWQDSGVSVSLRMVQGPAFWRTVEIETLPELIDVTAAVAEDLSR